MITSRNNNKVKNVRKLIEQAKARKEEELFVVEGMRIMEEAPLELVDEVFVSESLYKSNREIGNGIAGKVKEILGVPEKEDSFKTETKIDLRRYENIEVVADDVFRSMCDTVNPQGIMAVLRQPVYSVDDAYGALSSYDDMINQVFPHRSEVAASWEQISEAGFPRYKILILDDIQDPGNLGTMIRTSEAAGVDLVIMSSGCVDIFNPKVIRSTMGSIFRVPFVVAEDLPTEIERLKIAGVQVVSTSLASKHFYYEQQYTEKVAIVIGNEGNGISDDVLQASSCSVKIPMAGKVESLNAAISAAVLLYSI